jgi:cell division protein FtsI/penicillin-binding protein 2
MRGFGHAIVVAAIAALAIPVDADRAAVTAIAPSYVLIDAATERVLDAHWEDLARPLPLGSLIKPFTALAYAGTHRFIYPTFTCRGSADGCWLPAGHGTLGIVDAVAGSCNTYFRRLAEQTAPGALVDQLRWLGMRTGLAAASTASMVGYGDALRLAPADVLHGYLELGSRATQPGVPPILQGMRQSARVGTGRAAGLAIGGGEAMVKTGTAPCSHSPRAMADGYTIAIYPADRPRVALLMQAHGRTGAETAALAGRLLAGVLKAR